MKNIFVIIVVSIIIFAPQAIADTTSTFTLPSGVEVKIIEAPFQKALFKVEGCSEGDLVCRINSHAPAGIAFGLPKTYVKSITVSFQGRSYSLDVSDMYNAWGSRPLEHEGKIRYFGGKCFNSKNCQFRGLFSDAAGTFVAEWRIVNELPIRTVLTDSDDVVNLFTRNIDPPEYE
jgi:hypothetical protein